MKRLLFIFFCWCTVTQYAQYNGISHKVFEKKDGLEIDWIKAITYDDNGFIWLGGVDNDLREIVSNEKKLLIQRFAGNLFHSFKLPEGQNKKLQKVIQILKRKDGLLYVHALDEVFLFNPKNQEFKLLFKELVAQQVLFSKIFYFNNSYYLLSQLQKEIVVYKINNSTLEKITTFTRNTNKYAIDESTQFIPTKDYFVTSDDNYGITFIAWDGTVLKELPLRIQKGGNIKKVFIDEVILHSHTYYVLMREDPNLYSLKEKELQFSNVNFQSPTFTNTNLKTWQPATNTSIIGTVKEKRVLLYQMKDSKFDTLYDYPIFPSRSPLQLLSDRQLSTMYIGNSKGQLHKIAFPNSKIKTHLIDQGIRAITNFNDGYLFATESQGWFTLDATGNTIKPFDVFLDGKKIAPNSSRNFVVDKDTVWSTSGGGFVAVSKKTQQSNYYRYHPVTCFEQKNDSLLIFGTKNFTLGSFNKKSKKFATLLKTDTLIIYDISIHKNILVGATNKGVLIYNFKTQAHQFFGEETFKAPYMLMTAYHPKYGLLVGSRNGIVYTYSINNNNFSVLYKDQKDAGIATILFEEDVLWINTFNGFVMYKPTTNEVQRFSKNNGFSDNEANRYSAFQDENSFIIGTINGINIFSPKGLYEQKVESNLVLLKTKNYDTQKQKIVSTYNQSLLDSKIILPAEFKELELDFGLTNQIVPTDYQYRYRINNTEWVDNKSSQSIRFPNLAPGNYTLEIQAINFSGKPIAKSLFIEIISKNFFYKTWWFYLGLFLLLTLLSIYLLKQARSKQLLQEEFSENLLESQEVERTRIAKELHDSVGQQLTLIKKKAQNSNNDELTSLTHTTLEEVRNISRALYPTVLKQLGLSASIEQLIYEVDEETDMLFTVSVDDIDAYFTSKQSLNVYRFFQECINNILKHSQATSVAVKVYKSEQSVILQIRDNGKGFNTQDKLLQNSLGLKTISERIRILEGNLTIDSKLGNGTTIVAKIPV